VDHVESNPLDLLRNYAHVLHTVVLGAATSIETMSRSLLI